MPHADAVAPTIPFALERAQRDGCGCPEWVVRCAHFEGRIVFFAKRLETKHTCGRIQFRSEPYCVGTDSGWIPCEHVACPDVMGCDADFSLFPNLPAAEAEFHRREQELIGSSG